MKSAINWFEISTADLDRAQKFYETVLDCTLRRESMGPAEYAVFPHTAPGVGGALMSGAMAGQPGAGGTLIYLDGGASLDATLARVTAAGGEITLPRQALPPGMGFFAHITDPDGNRIGLHAMA